MVLGSGVGGYRVVLTGVVSLRAGSGAGGHPVALSGGGRRVLRRRAALVPQPGPQQGSARYGHGDLQTSLPGEGEEHMHTQTSGGDVVVVMWWWSDVVVGVVMWWWSEWVTLWWVW